MDTLTDYIKAYVYDSADMTLDEALELARKRDEAAAFQLEQDVKDGMD